MERKKRAVSPCVGKLPALAPLANPYVPFQMDNPEQYDAKLGLVRGTMYPGLDLPFMGMVNKKPLPASPMSELQEVGFALYELALYLDTHRDDQEALELYRKYQKLYHEKKQEYSRNHSPLSHGVPVDDPEYTWLSDPWPWEYCANKEG